MADPVKEIVTQAMVGVSTLNTGIAQTLSSGVMNVATAMNALGQNLAAATPDVDGVMPGMAGLQLPQLPLPGAAPGAAPGAVPAPTVFAPTKPRMII